MFQEGTTVAALSEVTVNCSQAISLISKAIHQMDEVYIFFLIIDGLCTAQLIHPFIYYMC